MVVLWQKEEYQKFEEKISNFRVFRCVTGDEKKMGFD